MRQKFFAGCIALAFTLSFAALADPVFAKNGATVRTVAGKCPAGRILCKDWCEKYRPPEGREMCLRLHPRSCMAAFGSLMACVGDRPAND